MAATLPKWHQEADIFRKIKSCLVLEGNVLDKYSYPLEGGTLQQGALVRLTEYLHYYFKDLGYENIVMYDSIHGFFNKTEAGYLDRFAELTQARVENSCIRVGFNGKDDSAPTFVEKALTQTEHATAVIMDFASRYITDPAQMNQRDVEGFTILLQATLDAKDARTTNASGTLKNLVVLLVNKLNDIPAWFYLSNPQVKPIMLGTPSKEEREGLVKGNRFQSFFDRSVYNADIHYYNEHPDELSRIQDKFVGLTEGFTLTEFNNLRVLCKTQGTHIKDMCSVIDLYKFGIKDNPWNQLDPDSFKNAYADFEKRVKGQPFALNQTLDVIKRAMTGMSGITSSGHGKPKGVLFFAGPTGTGKTETAKTLAEKLFGDERACIRFDMSEFAQPHSDQRLLGAPPGYVGYEAGGQLTNAVKKNPFSILLFDEIEKAHPSILDKFLQILEDGRMTDGKGETVYFSETIIIFTSNLGIYMPGPNGQRVRVVDSSMPYEEVRKTVRDGIEQYFKYTLGRPEILNRIGENIVVFDFIREEIAERILRAQIDKIIGSLRSEKNIFLTVSPGAFNTLLTRAIGNLDNGGRGIGNIVESLFINPLSRFMFDEGLFKDASITVNEIDAEQTPCTMRCSYSSNV